MSVIQASGVTVRLGPKTIVDGVDIDVGAGRLVGLIGPNGSGKTTLVRALLRLERLQSGTVSLFEEPLPAYSARRLAQTIAYLPQGQPVQWPVTVARLVALGRLPHLQPWQAESPADRAAVDAALATAEVGHLADRVVTTLSGGERARVMLARALAIEAPVLIADEPIAALDPYHQLHVMEMLRAYAERHTTVIVVLHDLTLAARFCDDLVLMDGGRVHVSDLPSSVLQPKTVQSVYRVEALSGDHDGQRYVLPWRRHQPSSACFSESG